MSKEQSTNEGMHKRRIQLADGRYMIFYTFDTEALAPPYKTQTTTEQPTKESAERENV